MWSKLIPAGTYVPAGAHVAQSFHGLTEPFQCYVSLTTDTNYSCRALLVIVLIRPDLSWTPGLPPAKSGPDVLFCSLAVFVLDPWTYFLSVFCHSDCLFHDESCNQTWKTKTYGIGLHSRENCMILASTILSQYTRVTDDDDRQTTDNILCQ